ncbi:glutathione S-transferase 1-1-like [Armigeres subalbatus]|uniref:glutathione S-transferase 1-1-like n=1 Tax=Armigeres subalbatus TaxID=124917 RepID=UPI002ED04A7C
MDLYYMPVSPSCWSVLLLNRQLGLSINLKPIDFQAGDHKKESFLKINPAHTIPTLTVGDEYALGESRSIMVYLVESQTNNGTHSLYPLDAKLRGLIHNRLDFDLGTLYQRFVAYCSPLYTSGTQGTEENRAKAHEALETLDIFLGKFRFAAADHLTIADFSLMATVSAFDLCYFDRSKYENVSKWYKACTKELVGYEDVILKGFPEWRKFIPNPELITK